MNNHLIIKALCTRRKRIKGNLKNNLKNNRMNLAQKNVDEIFELNYMIEEFEDQLITERLN